MMSTNEDWPHSWNGAATFHNKDSGNPNYYNKTFPLGGRINKAPILLSDFLNQPSRISAHPNYSSELQPGDSILITYNWTQADTIPNPQWIYGVVNNQKLYSNNCTISNLSLELT